MKIEQKQWTSSKGWGDLQKSEFQPQDAELVLGFGERFILEDRKRFEELKKMYPAAHILLVSTSGNIFGTSVEEHSLVITAIHFEKGTKIEIKKINIKETEDSYKAGTILGEKLTKQGLVHVLLIADGHLVNGSELVKGVLSVLSQDVAITGGLAGDGNRFQETLVGMDSPPINGEIVVVGFYGQSLKVGFGSLGGWDPFGIERKITRSSNNVLYELDGKCALDLYKNYLGEQAKELPGSALLFPLAIRSDLQAKPLVRTILSINEEDKSMVFAGDIPEGWYAQLMKANFDRLVDGALQAASMSQEMLGEFPAELAILVSCVGRFIVLGQRTEDEIEAVQSIIGNDAVITGFYSYGEIAPTAAHAGCELHNQTMTITVLSEK